MRQAAERRVECRSSPRPDACGRVFFFSSRRRHTRFDCDWSSDVCSSDLSPLGTVGWEVLRMTGRTRLVLWNLIANSIAFVVIGIGLGTRIGVVGVVIGYYVATLINSLVIFVLPSQIGWPTVLQVVREVVLLYLACALPLVLVGLLPLPPAARFGIDLILFGCIGVWGMRPLVPLLRSR